MKSQKAAVVRFDAILLGAVVALVAIGLVMVYSASALPSHDKTGNGFFYLKRQLVAAALGLGAMAAAMWLGYRRLARLAYPILFLAIGLMVLVLVPGIGGSAGGAQRWIRLPGTSIQPSEILKFAWVVYLAYSLAKKREKVASFSVGFLPHFLLAGLLACLSLAQPDFGSAVALMFLLFTLLFAAGAKLSYLVGSVLVALPVAYHLVASSPYRLKRITAFLDPWGTRHGEGYQVAESLLSIGSGGVTGLGLGDGRQKLGFVPELHTDFIFSIIGEELGLVGITLVLVLYGVVIWRGIRAALHASEPFGTYLALGVTSLFAFQAIVNMCVASGLLPTKGLTLPFISYGGSSLVVMMGAAGVLLSVSAMAEARAGAGRSSRQVAQEASA
jgi:cell division protein FtsW